MNTAVILAGGVGERVGAGIPKQFIKVLGKPILIYTLEAFEKSPLIDRIVLVCVGSHLELAKEYCREYGITKAVYFVTGGADFLHSCINGMNNLRDVCTADDNVVITSADRPFISEEEIEDALRVCRKKGSGIAARPCSLCMFRVGKDRSCSDEYMREELVQTATPWAFRYQPLMSALDDYEKGLLPECENYPIAIYAAAGNTVYFSKANAENIKITEPCDVALMEQMLIRTEESGK